MEETPKVNAPYSVAALVLGIVSVSVRFAYAELAVGIVGLVLASKGMKTYNEDPDRYKGEGNLKAGLVCSIVGTAMGGIAVLNAIF